MAFSVRQSRTLKAYCCLRGLENEVTSDFCLAPFHKLMLNYYAKVPIGSQGLRTTGLLA